MTTTVVKRRRKKLLVVGKDLNPSTSIDSEKLTDKVPFERPKLSLKPKKNKVNPPAPMSKPQVVAKPKPIKPPCSPKILKDKQLGRILRLCDALPHLFSIEHPRPLAVGVTDDLLARNIDGLSKKVIRSGIQCYTKLPQYSVAIQRGEKRINADGLQTDPPSDEHIEHAGKQLARWAVIKEKWPDLVSTALANHPNIFTEI